MFSTLSSILPGARALSEKLDKLDLHRDQPVAQPDEQDQTAQPDVAEGSKKEKKKKSTSNETFIVVRPPPAMNNHPLNLQLQLVPAQHTRDRSNTSTVTPTTSRISVASASASASASVSVAVVANAAGNGTADAPVPPSPSASDTDHSLQRTQSARSDRSDVSTFYASASSSGSVTSVASTASTSSGRRMIIPLYNLSAHNVMTNTILDAGTDAKVAKFLKRGIEVINLAILEPVEVWNGTANPAADSLEPPIRRTTSRNSLAPPQGLGAGSRAATPDPAYSPVSSRLSLSSEHSSNPPHPKDHQATPQQSTSTKKIFGRIFRRKEASTGGNGSLHTPTPSDAAPSPPGPLIPELRTPPKLPPPALRQEIILPPVLGLSPTATKPPSGRCIAHVWTVRRWLKTENQSLISGVIGKISREVSVHGYGGAAEQREWEVRFEWARGRSKGEKARGRRRPSIPNLPPVPVLPSSQRSSALITEESPTLVELNLQQLDGRASSPRRAAVPVAVAAVSVAPTVPSDDEPGTGDESDPEDSETPWTCTLVLTYPDQPMTPVPSRHRRTQSVPSAAWQPPPAIEPVRLKVATLTPAPHHPKVVCQLKIPFPLPDVEVDNGVMRKRLVVPHDGTTRSTVPRERGGGAGAGLVMTAEEIKDVVCSTAFWVIVRQGFGGLGKKTRKGDGWNIRG